jgi:hypothetical protein
VLIPNAVSSLAIQQRQGPARHLGRGLGRKAIIAAYERRLAQETTHPVFGYQVSMRPLIEVQMRLLRHLDGELPDYPHYTPRRAKPERCPYDRGASLYRRL